MPPALRGNTLRRKAPSVDLHIAGAPTSTENGHMITQDQLRTLAGTTAYDRSGDKIGKVGAVYYDDRTDEPK